MSIVRFNSSLNDYVPTSFSTLVDRFFDESLSRSGGAAYSFVPKVDVIEQDKSYEIHVVVPGMNKQDFKIDLNENYLTVSGERKWEREHNEKNVRRIESQYGTFSRSFTLPEHVDASKIDAKYNNGILEIIIPKDEKKTLKTTIKVN